VKPFERQRTSVTDAFLMARPRFMVASGVRPSAIFTATEIGPP
jgi:hypothetical protein